MTDTPDATCQKVCQGVSLLAALLALWVTWGPFPALGALMFSGGFGVIFYLSLSRMACVDAGMARNLSLVLGLEKDTSFSTELGEEAAKAAEPPLPLPKAIRPTEEAAKAAEGTALHPACLSAPEGEPDDLTRIKGIGPKLAALCHGMGVYHYRQIAAWTADDVAWMDDNLTGFRGRVSRDDWVAQAKALAGGETRRENRVKTTKDAPEPGQDK